MKNKGFTLVELIGVIVILGIVMALSFPVLLNSMNKTEKRISDSTKKIIETASKDYVSKNYLVEDEKYTYCVKLNDMVEDGYLSTNQTNDLDLNDYVKINFSSNNEVKSSVVTTCNEVKLTDGGYNTFSFNSIIYFNPYNSKKCTQGTENCMKWITIEREDDASKNAIDLLSFDCLYSTKVAILKNTYLKYKMDNVWDSSLNARLISFSELSKITGVTINDENIAGTVSDTDLIDGTSCTKSYIATNTIFNDDNALLVLKHSTASGDKLAKTAFNDTTEADVKLVITVPKKALN